MPSVLRIEQRLNLQRVVIRLFPLIYAMLLLYLLVARLVPANIPPFSPLHHQRQPPPTGQLDISFSW